jgi:hypothetical protein
MKGISIKAFFTSLDSKDIILKYCGIIFLGALVVYLNDREMVNPILNTWFVFVLAAGKNIFFVVQSLQKISHVINKNVAYFKFLIFMAINILVIIFSYAIDFFCLYQIDRTHFTGLPPDLNLAQLIFEFFYLSLLGFNNLGFYDVIPASLLAKALVMGEIMIYYFAIILVLSDFVNLRDSIIEERLKRKIHS